MTQIRNTAIIRETLALFDQDEKLANVIRASIDAQTVVLQSDELPVPAPRFDKPAKIVVSRKRTLEAARAYVGQPTTVLNFASAIRPGGGVMTGSRAQEESLCRCSTLYPCLKVDAIRSAFYAPHREEADSRNNDDCIYTPGVLVIRDDTDHPEMLPPEEYYPVDVITCAAPLLQVTMGKAEYFIKEEYFTISEEELYELHLRRARRIMHLAASRGAETLILGAFGCGAFQNDPFVVSRAIMDAVRECRHLFRTIEFAIYCTKSETRNYKAFASAAAAL